MGDPTGCPMQSETPTEVTLDGNDVAKLVECAIRHPTPNMRHVVLAAIWNHLTRSDRFSSFGDHRKSVLDISNG
jgi:hypothetical protein